MMPSMSTPRSSRSPQSDPRTASARNAWSVLAVARLFSVSAGVVRRWADQGVIECWRLPGGQAQRRFTTAAVANLARRLDRPDLVARAWEGGE